jgi:hypothetical protein
MKKDQVLGLVRHALTAIGGAIVAKGLLEGGLAEELIGAVMTIIGAAWSFAAKKNVA